MFYLFEPFRVVSDMIKNGDIDKSLENSTKFELIENIFNCRFPAYFVHHIRRWGLAAHESNSLKGVCNQYGGCKNTTPEKLSESCTMYEHIGVKVIRLESLQLLEPLVRYDTNLKVLHLVRDPRGVVSSRKYMYKNANNRSINTMGHLRADLKAYCQRMVEMLRVVSDPPEWLEGRYKILRYEDTATDPINSVKSIYKFLNLPLPENVTDWIDNNTKEDHNVKSVMGTKKNSTAAAQSWRSRLIYDDVNIVQHLSPCLELMDLMGYKRMDSQSHMRNLSYRSF
ncbi:carbohydrate sulfotransferase 1-like [Saccoglossus kowalevskii]